MLWSVRKQPMQLGWRIVLGSVMGFLGAAFGSVGGIFVPMLPLIIGFDPKSSTATSKCNIFFLRLLLCAFLCRQLCPLCSMHGLLLCCID
jgi:uncharacterized membrane protein YfcA